VPSQPQPAIEHERVAVHQQQAPAQGTQHQIPHGAILADLVHPIAAPLRVR
jgi:hypothetical protein